MLVARSREPSRTPCQSDAATEAGEGNSTGSQGPNLDRVAQQAINRAKKTALRRIPFVIVLLATDEVPVVLQGVGDLVSHPRDIRIVRKARPGDAGLEFGADAARPG